MTTILRDEKGRFQPGGAPKSPGRPRRATEREYLDALFGVVSLERWEGVVMAQLKQALKGDTRAATFLANYCIGKPAESVLMARIEALEALLDQTGATKQ